MPRIHTFPANTIIKAANSEGREFDLDVAGLSVEIDDRCEEYEVLQLQSLVLELRQRKRLKSNPVISEQLLQAFAGGEVAETAKAIQVELDRYFEAYPANPNVYPLEVAFPFHVSGHWQVMGLRVNQDKTYQVHLFDSSTQTTEESGIEAINNNILPILTAVGNGYHSAGQGSIFYHKPYRQSGLHSVDMTRFGGSECVTEVNPDYQTSDCGVYAMQTMENIIESGFDDAARNKTLDPFDGEKIVKVGAQLRAEQAVRLLAYGAENVKGIKDSKALKARINLQMVLQVMIINFESEEVEDFLRDRSDEECSKIDEFLAENFAYLSKKIDLNKKYKGNHTLIYYALRHGFPKFAKSLIEADVDLCVKTTGRTLPIDSFTGRKDSYSSREGYSDLGRLMDDVVNRKLRDNGYDEDVLRRISGRDELGNLPLSKTGRKPLYIFDPFSVTGSKPGNLKLHHLFSYLVGDEEGSYSYYKRRFQEELKISESIIKFDDENKAILLYAPKAVIMGSSIESLFYEFVRDFIHISGKREYNKYTQMTDFLAYEYDDEKFMEKANKFFSDLPPTDNLKKVNGLEELVSQSFCVGEAHGDTSPKKFLIQNMQKLKENGYDTFFMEFLFQDTAMQDLLDEYFESSDENMPVVLESYLKRQNEGHRVGMSRVTFDKTVDEDGQDYNYLTLIKEAKKQGIRIVGLETISSSMAGMGEYGAGGKARYKGMNYAAHQVISEQMRLSKTKKWFALMGNAHIGNFDGVPGVANLMSVPAVDVYQVEQDEKEEIFYNGSRLVGKESEIHSSIRIQVKKGSEALVIPVVVQHRTIAVEENQTDIEMDIFDDLIESRAKSILGRSTALITAQKEEIAKKLEIPLEAEALKRYVLSDEQVSLATQFFIGDEALVINRSPHSVNDDHFEDVIEIIRNAEITQDRIITFGYRDSFHFMSVVIDVPNGKINFTNSFEDASWRQKFENISSQVLIPALEDKFNGKKFTINVTSVEERIRQDDSTTCGVHAILNNSIGVLRAIYGDEVALPMIKTKMREILGQEIVGDSLPELMIDAKKKCFSEQQQSEMKVRAVVAASLSEKIIELGLRNPSRTSEYLMEIGVHNDERRGHLANNVIEKLSDNNRDLEGIDLKVISALETFQKMCAVDQVRTIWHSQLRLTPTLNAAGIEDEITKQRFFISDVAEGDLGVVVEVKNILDRYLEAVVTDQENIQAVVREMRESQVIQNIQFKENVKRVVETVTANILPKLRLPSLQNQLLETISQIPKSSHYFSNNDSSRDSTASLKTPTSRNSSRISSEGTPQFGKKKKTTNEPKQLGAIWEEQEIEGETVTKRNIESPFLPKIDSRFLPASSLDKPSASPEKVITVTVMKAPASEKSAFFGDKLDARGGGYKTIDGVYSSNKNERAKEVDEVMTAILVNLTHDTQVRRNNGGKFLSKEQMLQIIDHARRNGGVAAKKNQEGDDAVYIIERDKSEIDKELEGLGITAELAICVSTKYQKQCQKCGILSGFEASSNGDRLCFLTDSARALLEKTDITARAVIVDSNKIVKEKIQIVSGEVGVSL